MYADEILKDSFKISTDEDVTIKNLGTSTGGSPALIWLILSVLQTMLEDDEVANLQKHADYTVSNRRITKKEREEEKLRRRAYQFKTRNNSFTEEKL